MIGVPSALMMLCKVVVENRDGEVGIVSLVLHWAVSVVKQAGAGGDVCWKSGKRERLS